MDNANLPPSVSLCENYISPAVASQLFSWLVNTIPWKQESLKFGDKEVPLPRLTAWVGEKDAVYAYSGITNIPVPWDNILSSLRLRLEKDLNVPFNSVLLNYYRSGQDSIGWHSDDEKELGLEPTIASISLGGMRQFLIRPIAAKANVQKIALLDGSLLVMSGKTQQQWQHAVAKEVQAVPRINLTFRNIKG